jgi:hypothetical protein
MSMKAMLEATIVAARIQGSRAVDSTLEVATPASGVMCRLPLS